MKRLSAIAVAAIVTMLGLAAESAAQTFNRGSTEADGAFAPTTSVTRALPLNGVFHFTTVNIPPGVTVRFTRNAANTPVTLLASGDVTIAGTIDVSGSNGVDGSGATSVGNSAGTSGPGGFDGGNAGNGLVSSAGGQGLGPGGGGGATVAFGAGGGGGFGTNGGAGLPGGGGTAGAGGSTYGAAALLPIVGGSGGGAGAANFGTTAGGGGGGGGTLVIASSGTINFTDSLIARGGDGGRNAAGAGGTGGAGAGGSGGAIRIVATSFVGGGGTISVAGGAGGPGGGNGGAGRIRVEAYTYTASVNYAGVPPSVASPSSVQLASAPSLRITAVGGIAAPASPSGSYATPDVTLPAGTTTGSVSLVGANIPPGTAVTVTVAARNAAATSTTATLTGPSAAATTATVSVTIPANQPSVIGASASFTLTAANGGPVFIEREVVERVRVSATVGGASAVTYVTRSGREIVLAR